MSVVDGTCASHDVGPDLPDIRRCDTRKATRTDPVSKEVRATWVNTEQQASDTAT